MVKAFSSSFFAIAAASFLLLASSVVQAECTFFTGFADNKDGTVTDTRNGLIWKRCAEGRDFRDGVCVGSSKEVSRSKNDFAMQMARESRFLDKSDWRLPTKEEFAAVMGSYNDCSDNPEGEYAASKAIAYKNEAFWTSTPTDGGSALPAWFASFGDGLIGGKGMGFSSDVRGNSRSAHVRLVRSGQVLGRTPSLEFVSEKSDKAAALARHRAVEDVRQRKQDEANERTLTAFRNSINEGDDTSSGMVIQVKGNLVKIQTNDSQCSQRKSDGSCANYINTPAEKWFKRSEVYPK